MPDVTGFDLRFDVRWDVDESGWNFASGLLLLGDEPEAFHSSLAFFDADAYERHWRRAIARLVDGAGYTAFWVSYGPDIDANDAWQLWSYGDEVVFHERFVPNGGEADDIVRTPDEPWRHISPVHRRISLYGEPISEWVVSRAAIAAWLQAK